MPSPRLGWRRRCWRTVSRPRPRWSPSRLTRLKSADHFRNGYGEPRCIKPPHCRGPVRLPPPTAARSTPQSISRPPPSPSSRPAPVSTPTSPATGRRPPAAGAGIGPADYGGRFAFGILGGVDLAIRGVVFTAFTAAPVSLSGAGAVKTFPSNQDTKLTVGVADYIGTGGLAGTIGSGSQNIANRGGRQCRRRRLPGVPRQRPDQLTLPINFTIVANVGSQSATLNVQGDDQRHRQCAGR